MRLTPQNNDYLTNCKYLMAIKKILIITIVVSLLLFIPNGVFADEEASWYEITTSVENGSIDDGRTVKKGSNAIIKVEASEGYILSSVWVDGQPKEPNNDIIDNVGVLMNTVDAFYARGEEAQYDNHLRENYISPYQEETIYTDCSGFTFASYYNAFGIEIPTSTRFLDEYARNYENTEFVISYMDYEEYQSSIGELMESVFTKLKRGDLITIRTDANKGHTMMVYDFEKNRSGEITDVIIIHSTGKNDEYEKQTCCYDEDVIEGTIRKASMKARFSERYSGTNIVSFSVIRPLAKPGLFLNYRGEMVQYSSIEEGYYYLFENIQSNHDIMIRCKKKPFYKMKGVTENGFTPGEVNTSIAI